MSEIKPIDSWNAYKIGQFEYRLCGLVERENGKWSILITEPIVGVNSKDKLVETQDGNFYEPRSQLSESGAGMMDRMYIIDRWLTTNGKSDANPVTKFIVELLEGKVL